MTESLKVLVVDDQPRARQSLRALLATWPQVGQVQEAANGKQAIGLVLESLPDVVLMDARMPVMDGLEATRFIKAHYPGVRVIILSMYPEYEDEAKTCGADAFVSKGESPDKLLDALIEDS
jgi:two-component system NarL family response regulator